MILLHNPAIPAAYAVEWHLLLTSLSLSGAGVMLLLTLFHE
jgi:hypothetical protein